MTDTEAFDWQKAQQEDMEDVRFRAQQIVDEIHDGPLGLEEAVIDLLNADLHQDEQENQEREE